MSLEKQVEIMEAQINSPEAGFTLIEKLQYLTSFFAPDPEFTQEAMDIVMANLCESVKL